MASADSGSAATGTETRPVRVRGTAGSREADDGLAGCATAGMTEGSSKEATGSAPGRSPDRSPAPTENSGKASAATATTVPGKARDQRKEAGAAALAPVRTVPAPDACQPTARSSG
ncbi:hypothetical protein [Erythrobacter dokdonensis]|uniref:hypothetical protein n=1 Tax=Erythrobacter dokdonensis TaxID=328225 RepID=UPI00117D84C6|nr:hypothetical protein [Erythrobacter dokdonensis]